MGLFDSFLDTASKAFSWLDNNKAALDLVAGAAKGYGSYLQNKQSQQQFDFQRKMYENEQRRLDDTTKAPNAYNSGDYTAGIAGFNPGTLLEGSIANAMQVGVKK